MWKNSNLSGPLCPAWHNGEYGDVENDDNDEHDNNDGEYHSHDSADEEMMKQKTAI